MTIMWNETELTSGPLPLWWQIADRLRRAIEHGEFKAGDALPSETQLNEAFGVSRTTARAALDKLEQEGLIFRKAGRGSVVLDPKVEQPLSRLSSFAEDMRQRGLSASYHTYGIAAEAAPSDVAQAFDIAEGTPVLHIIRLLKADGLPMGMSHSWLHPDVLGNKTPPQQADLNSRSLYDWLETNCGARIVGGSETIEAAVTDRRLSQQLEIPLGSAVLVARRISRGTNRQPIEYAVISYRADRYRFTIDLVRQ
ncbi:MAG: GntR family transcriptional regulator [Rhizobiaceae bacterium]|nr:GntR family transcriptional regulator [Rhizobiaceae bacterium]